MLCKRFGKQIGGLTTGKDNKMQFWNELCIAIRDGCFGVLDKTTRTHYESMMYEVSVKDGSMDFEHSDDWMALMMGWMAMQMAEIL
jgi:hypothetical protein